MKGRLEEDLGSDTVSPLAAFGSPISLSRSTDELNGATAKPVGGCGGCQQKGGTWNAEVPYGAAQPRFASACGFSDPLVHHDSVERPWMPPEYQLHWHLLGSICYFRLV